MKEYKPKVPISPRTSCSQDCLVITSTDAYPQCFLTVLCVLCFMKAQTVDERLSREMNLSHKECKHTVEMDMPFVCLKVPGKLLGSAFS